jgi:hypothetical protein
VTAADVQRVAGRFLDSDRSAVVVVGPVEGFRAQLENLGPLQIRDIHGRPAES